MSWLLAFLGFSLLIVLHELGHFAAAKAVGMRVERFSLFFPPLILRRQGKGETEYAIGSIPLGGYVKISGMNPHEELPPEHAHRAYFRQPVWKRVTVILAGPMVNIVLAGVILTGLVLHNGKPVDGARVEQVQADQPATGLLREGDRIVSVDGRTGAPNDLSKQIGTHTCKERLVAGCVAATPAVLVVGAWGDAAHDRGPSTLRRGARAHAARLHAVDAARAGRPRPRRRRIGRGDVALHEPDGHDDRPRALRRRAAQAGVRHRGLYETTRQAVKLNLDAALYVLAVISLSLGVINLFPFLPLDGGHIFWALAEKVRGRAIPFSVMERAGFVGFALVAVLFFIGFTNDIGRLTGEGFGLGN